MTVTAIVGANWGDEGKGKITDYLAGHADLVVRFQGGANAGHTIINDYGKFAMHLLPSGVFRPDVVNVLGTGMAIDIGVLMQEFDNLRSRGVPEPTARVSDRAQVVMPYHTQLDALEERRLGDRQFGSTKAGIAPFYADKAAKLGVQIADLFDADRLRNRITDSLAIKNVLFKHLYASETLTADALVETMLSQGRQIRPLVCDTVALLHTAIAQGQRVLLEGQLGTLRDPDHGIYPYPTSSSPLAGFASVGAGVPPYAITRIVAVTKAYSSCVGAGPFTTELQGPAAETLRARGGDAGEYGARTGRPRRVGWFDAVATAYGRALQHATEVALTNLDVLSYLPEIPICTAYRIDGQTTQRFPVPALLDRAEPIYDTLPGWQCDISNARRYNALPPHARRYVETIESAIGAPIRMISVGPQRDAMILRHEP